MHSLFLIVASSRSFIYPLSLHDALPISHIDFVTVGVFSWARLEPEPGRFDLEWLDAVLDDLHSRAIRVDRSEEHTSELQSRGHLVCRLLLEKKKCANSYSQTVDSYSQII